MEVTRNGRTVSSKTQIVPKLAGDNLGKSETTAIPTNKELNLIQYGSLIPGKGGGLLN